MPIGLCFWMLMILWFIFGVFTNWPPAGAGREGWAGFGGTVLQFVLLALLGLRVFGPPLQ